MMKDAGPPELSWNLLQALLHAHDARARVRFEHAAAMRDLADARAKNVQLETSTSFRLGYALVDSLRSWHGLMALPRRLLALRHRKTPASAEPGSVMPSDALVPGELELMAAAFQSFVDPATKLSELRIACVLDTFTHEGFAPECLLFELPLVGFEAVIDQAKPHLLLVESAWRGTNGSWRDRIAPVSPELQTLLDGCRRRGIPTVFWNKEDPFHYDHFIGTAKLFDHVFTTDAGSVPRYRAAFGHDRVGVLQFYCQPSIHHPLEIGPRSDGACFAGSWYQKYPERSDDFAELVEAVSRVMPVTIYDRNHDRKDPAFQFPQKYASMLQAGVPYNQVAHVYKSYRFGITVNTVTQSPTMFARRVYELLACNTVVVSNQSLGLSSVFGENVVTCGREQDCGALLRDLHASERLRHAWLLKGLREVLQAHTAAHRLAKIANVALGTETFQHRRQQVLVVSQAYDQAQVATVLDAFASQEWPDREMLLVVPDELEARVRSSQAFAMKSQVMLVPVSHAATMQVADVARGHMVACFDPRDGYGPNYLTDLALATLYAPELPVGKGSCFVTAAGRSTLRHGPRYRSRSPLRLRSALVPVAMLPAGSLLDVLALAAREDGVLIEGVATDEFNYCLEGASQVTDNTPGASEWCDHAGNDTHRLRREDFGAFQGTYSDQVGNGFRPRRDNPPLKLKLPLEWDMDPFHDRNWCFQLHAWRMLGPVWSEFYGKDWARLRAEVLPWVRDWYEFHVAQQRQSPFAWYDMSVGLRAQHLALLVNLHRQGTMPLCDDDWQIVHQLARLHVDKLMQESFVKLNNHGMFQLIGLRLLGIAMRGSPACKGEPEYSARKMRELLDLQFDQFGIHKENSPDYHGLILKQVARIRTELFPDIADVITRITSRGRAALPWFTLPDNLIAQIGDSEGYGQALGGAARADGVLRTAQGDEVWVRDLSQSGYGVVRTAPEVPQERASMLIIKGQAFSQTHAHADHLGFILFAAGRPLLVDSGKFSYRRDKWREYFVSDRAHNVVGLQTRAFGPQHTTTVGPGLQAMEIREDHVHIAGEVRRAGFFHHRRKVDWYPGLRVQVADRIRARSGDAPVAYWHLAPDLGVERIAQGVSVFDNGRRIATITVDNPEIRVRLIRGEEGARIQGWVSPSYNHKIPATAVEFRAPRDTTTINTSIELLDEPLTDAKTLPRGLTHGIRYNFDFRFKRDAIHVLPDGRTQRRVIVQVAAENLALAHARVRAQLERKGFSSSAPVQSEAGVRVSYSHADGTQVVTRTNSGAAATFYFAWSRLPPSKRKPAKRPPTVDAIDPSAAEPKAPIPGGTGTDGSQDDSP